MKVNKWTLGLAAAGVVSLGMVAQAEEASEHLMTAVSGTQISGYISTSASWMAGTGSRGGTAALPGRSFHDAVTKQDGFNLDVIDLTVSKPLDESEWAAGYKAELWFGPDAAAYGSSSVAGGNGEDFNIRQAYVELRAPVGNGIDMKVGVWDTVIGYEVSNHDGNPNFGRSYGWGIEPTSHTGILASYQVADFLSVSAGVANNGLANGINAKQPTESDKSYMASVSLTAPDDWGFAKGGTLTAGVVKSTISSPAGVAPGGLPGISAGNNADLLNYYVGGALPLPIEGWSIGAAYDYRGEGQDGTIRGNYANAYALYLSAKATDKLTVNLRADYTTANAGTYFAAGAGHNNELASLTTTLDYSLWENVLTRLEVRWDHQLSGGVADPNGGVGGGVFGGGTGAVGSGDKNAMTVTANVIYKF